MLYKGWIPVTQRKPAKGVKVLLLIECDDGSIHFDLGGVYSYANGPDGCWITDNDWYEGVENYYIRFWMPLPDIPDCYEEAHYELQ